MDCWLVAHPWREVALVGLLRQSQRPHVVNRARAVRPWHDLSVSDTYSDVDSSPNVGEAIDWQERIDRWPAIAGYKAIMDRLMGGGTPTLEIGSGPGLDAARTGAVGLDLSRAMADRARSRGVSVVVGDAHRLPVADESVAAVRADRVLRPQAVNERSTNCELGCVARQEVFITGSLEISATSRVTFLLRWRARSRSALGHVDRRALPLDVFCGRSRTTEVVTLTGVDTQGDQGLTLFLGLDALGYHLEPEGVT